MKQVIYFQGDGPCLGTWNKESKQYTWLSYNQVGSSIQVKPLVVSRRGGEETGGGEDYTLLLHPQKFRVQFF